MSRDNRPDKIPFLTLFPVVCLVVVAMGQAVFVRCTGHSPWKCGGFGMFSTVDSPGNRTLILEGIGNDGEHVRLRIPWRLERLARRSRHSLAESDLTKVLHALKDGRHKLRTPDGSDMSSDSLTGFRAELLRGKWQGATSQFHWESVVAGEVALR